MKRTKVKLLTALFMFAAFLFVQDAQAQHFVRNEVAALSVKSGVQPSDFIPTTEAAGVLKTEIEAMYSVASNLNGGSAEATNSLRLSFYENVLDGVTTGDSVIEAIRQNNSGLVAHSRGMSVSVNTDAILNDIIDLLSN